MKKIIISVMLLMFAFLSSGYALSGYQYYRDITIDNTGNSNTLTNYQVMISIDTASLISQGKLNNDCSDIRFTEADGITELSYWIEDGTCNTASTNIWVKVPSIPGSSTYTIQMWYGNPSATSASNIDNVFIFGDDFRSGTLDTTKWQTSSGEGSISISSDDKLIVSSTGDSPYVATQNSFSYPIVVEWKSSVSALDQLGGIGLVGSVGDMVDNQPNGELAFRDSDYRVTSGRIIVYDGSTIYYVLDNYGQNTYTYHRHKIVWNGAGYSAFYMDNNLLAEHTTNPTANQYFEISTRYRTADYAHYLDWVIVRAYANPEPTTAVGEEKVYSNSPIITITDPSSRLYYGIDKLNISFSVMDFDNSTLNVYAYVNGTEIYANTAYANNTAVGITYDVKGYFYNVSIVADDGISKVYSERMVHVLYGVNITSNTQGFDLTIEIGGVNTTYNGIDYKVIEWNEVGNNSIARVWVTKPGFDVAYKQILFNDSMGFWNEVMEIYTAHTFYIKDENGDYIKDWILTLNGSKAYSTNDYEIKISTRGLEEGYYLLNATALGYEYRTAIMELNNSYRVNYTFTTRQTDFILTVYDEETQDMVYQTDMEITRSDGKIIHTGNKRVIDVVNTNSPVAGSVERITDYDIINYVRYETGSNLNYYVDVNMSRTEVSRQICIRVKRTGDSTGASGSLQLQFYNRTSSSFNMVFSIYFRTIPEAITDYCVPINDPYNDYGNNMKVRIKLPATDIVYLDIFELYQKESPTGYYYFNASELANAGEEISIKLMNDNYAPRRYYIKMPEYSSLKLDAYLLRSNLGRIFAFNIVNSRDEPVYDAKVSALAYIDGAYRVVAQAKTDASATAYLFLKPEKEYYIKVEHPNYVSFYKQIIPYATSYRIKLSNVLDINFDSLFNGVSYALLPRGNSITEETTTFVFRVSSVNADIEYMSFVIRDKEDVLYSYLLDGSPSGGEVRYTLNLSEHNLSIGDVIYVEASFKKLGEKPYYINRTYFVWYYESNGTTLKDVLGDSSQYSDAFKALISFTIITLVVLGAVAVSGNVAVGMVVAVITTGILMAVGLMPFVAGSIAIVLGIALIIAFLR